MRFQLEESAGRLKPAMELRRGDRSQFEKALEGITLQPNPENWYQLVAFPDGSFYLRWPDLFEFLVLPDGRCITYNPLPQASPAAFETYLLGHVLSYSLLKLGYEVLHVTAVVVDGEALGLLGRSGQGKSSLAAAFLQAGYRILSDDLLVLVETPEGILIPPGLPRIKLFPETAERFLPFAVHGASHEPIDGEERNPSSQGAFGAGAGASPRSLQAALPFRAAPRQQGPNLAPGGENRIQGAFGRHLQLACAGSAEAEEAIRNYGQALDEGPGAATLLSARPRPPSGSARRHSCGFSPPRA